MLKLRDNEGEQYLHLSLTPDKQLDQSNLVNYSYPQLLGEIPTRLPYQVKKCLCEYYVLPQGSFLKRQIRKLLMYICGSRDKYQNFSLNNNEQCKTISTQIPYVTLMRLVDHLKSLPFILHLLINAISSSPSSSSSATSSTTSNRTLKTNNIFNLSSIISYYRLKSYQYIDLLGYIIIKNKDNKRTNEFLPKLELMLKT
ncbi:unnamed protein product [Rotaria sordida]|uniref:Uncharacterized protein n=1 Tax=Rotaria sordida TaxID=392033 RepID=A0A819QK91_9BILA|nr:unnamed protein product [Rotaria sordida]